MSNPTENNMSSKAVCINNTVIGILSSSIMPKNMYLFLFIVLISISCLIACAVACCSHSQRNRVNVLSMSIFVTLASCPASVTTMKPMTVFLFMETMAQANHWGRHIQVMARSQACLLHDAIAH